MRITAIAKNRASAGRLPVCGTAALLLIAGVGGSRAAGQDIKPVASGSVQSIHFGVNARAQAGSIARGPGGEQSGVGGFGVSEAAGRVVSGKVAGYGGPQVAGRLGEYGPGGSGGSGFAGGQDFPETDFVATMPRPVFTAGSAVPVPAGTGFGVTLRSVPPARAAHPASSAGAHASSGHSHLRSSDAIANPFTHSIAPGLGLSGGGMGTLGGIGLGAGSIQ